MKRVLDIRVRNDIDIYADVLKDARFLDCGASKTAYVKGETCYKVPIGYEELDSKSFTMSCIYPYEYEDFTHFIDYVVANENPALVWSIGQIVFEIMVWQHLLELKDMGYDISCFAEIKDFYIDKNGVPVIEQEFVHCSPEKVRELPYLDRYEFEDKNKSVLSALDDMGFCLTDIREGNMGYSEDGTIKCFDFGISSGSTLYNYDPYDEYYDYNNSCDEDEEEC